jgi:predicted dehydrogenase
MYKDLTMPGSRSAVPTFGGVRARMPSSVRSGIIGLGFIGEVHARAVHAAGGTLAAVADASADGIEASAQRLGALRGASSAQELVSSPDVDVVHICTPNHLHAPLARLALEAGKHVICEKPLATTAADAAELVELARAAGVVAAVPFIYRYYPTVREARARVASGSSGPVHLVHGSYLQDWLSTAKDQNWRVDPKLGGASRTFADIGVHWCDLVEFATGHRIVSLAARIVTAVPERASTGEGVVTQHVATEDAATLIFETDRGAIGSLVVSQVTPGRKNRLWFSIDGAETSMAFDQELPETLWVGSRKATTLVQRGAEDLSPDAQRLSVLPAGHPQGYQECFNGFVADVYAAIGGAMPVGLPLFEDGLRAARLTEAVLSSAGSRAWVEPLP